VLTGQELRKLLHAGVVEGIGLAIGSGDFASLDVTVTQNDRRTGGGQGQRAQAHVRIAKAMARKRQILDHRRLKQVQEVSE